MTMPTILVIPIDNAVRVCIDGVCHDKPMTPKQMRELAVALLRRADESERAEEGE